MDTLDKHVEREKVEFLTALTTQFGDIPLERIAVAASQIEEMVEGRLVQAFLANAGRILGLPRLTVAGAGFSVSGNHYEVTCAMDLRSRDTLVVSCSPQAPADVMPESLRHLVPLDTACRYRAVEVWTPRTKGKVASEFLHHLVNGIFSVGYRWLEDAITRAIVTATSNTNHELYRFVRVMVPNEQFLEGFWFSALVSDKDGDMKDIVLLDDVAARSSFGRAERNAGRVGRSAANLVTEMISEVVASGDSVISTIDATSSPQVIDLSRGSFYQSSTSFNVALRSIWGESVVCYPVVADGSYKVVAFFPSDMRVYLVPFLDLHREHLKAIAERSAQGVRQGLQVMKSIQRATRSPAWIGELLGGFAVGAAKQL